MNYIVKAPDGCAVLGTNDPDQAAEKCIAIGGTVESLPDKPPAKSMLTALRELCVIYRYEIGMYRAETKRLEARIAEQERTISELREIIVADAGEESLPENREEELVESEPPDPDEPATCHPMYDGR